MNNIHRLPVTVEVKGWPLVFQLLCFSTHISLVFHLPFKNIGSPASKIFPLVLPSSCSYSTLCISPLTCPLLQWSLRLENLATLGPHTAQSHSCMCHVINVMERLIFPFRTVDLNLEETQHSFRKHRSTTSPLLPLAYKVETGFNKPRSPPLRTVAMPIDLSKFLCCKPFCNTNLYRNFVIRLSTYLLGRHASYR